jgi:hypothetical protein
VPRMTRARTVSSGVVTPPPLDRWIDAVLMLFVSLVQGATTTLQMWLRIEPRDWHMQSEASALPQAKSGKQTQESNTTHGVSLGQAERDPRIPAGRLRGLAVDPHKTDNRDSRPRPRMTQLLEHHLQWKRTKPASPAKAGDTADGFARRTSA